MFDKRYGMDSMNSRRSQAAQLVDYHKTTTAGNVLAVPEAFVARGCGRGISSTVTTPAN